MNKQEVIEKIKNLEGLTILDNTINFDDEMVSKKEVLNIVKQLDEPVRPPEPKPIEIEKPVVPQYVADLYESIEDDFEDGVYGLCTQFYEESKLSDELYWWFKHEDNKPIETLVKMKLFGYEIEKEKLYTVEIPNPNKIGNERNVLMKNGFKQIVILRVYDYGDNWRNNEAYQLTEAEIKKDFEWAFRWAKEVE